MTSATEPRRWLGLKAAALDLLYPSLHRERLGTLHVSAFPSPRLTGHRSFAQTRAKIPAAAESTPLELDKINLQKTARCN